MAGEEEREAVGQVSTEDTEDSKPSGEEEDTGAEVAPIVKLDAVAVSTGEENEGVLIDLPRKAHSDDKQPRLPEVVRVSPLGQYPAEHRKAKLYRFDKDGNQWKERGVGSVKLLKHKETGKVRLVMRQNKTLKICANHTVAPSISLQEHQGSDKTWVWHASDFADGELKDELFCIRFGSVENAQAFKKAFEDAQSAKSSAGGEKDAAAVGELLEGLKVEEKREVEAEEKDVKESKVEAGSAEEKDGKESKEEAGSAEEKK